jgi:hypothetical protein
VRLRPDLHVVTATGDYEDHAFLEIDLGNEHLPQVINKCRQYVAYRHTGIEQQQHGVFPAVLWVTTDQQRADRLRRAIQECFGREDGLFRVLVAADLVGAMTEGGAS